MTRRSPGMFSRVFPSSAIGRGLYLTLAVDGHALGHSVLGFYTILDENILRVSVFPRSMAILAAVDENERSKHVISIAYDLAMAYDDTLVPLHVIPTEEYEAHRESLREIPEFRDFSITQEFDSARAIAKKFAVDVIEEIDRSVLEPRGRVGNISDEILAEAASLEPRFLVIGGRRRSPVGKAMFGNTAQKILLNADCPVVSKLSDE